MINFDPTFYAPGQNTGLRDFYKQMLNVTYVTVAPYVQQGDFTGGSGYAGITADNYFDIGNVSLGVQALTQIQLRNQKSYFHGNLFLKYYQNTPPNLVAGSQSTLYKTTGPNLSLTSWLVDQEAGVAANPTQINGLQEFVYQGTFFNYLRQITVDPGGAPALRWTAEYLFVGMRIDYF